MSENVLVCLSCKKRIANQAGTAIFSCPNCGKADIIRCKHCRLIAAKYECPECKFTGPN